MNESSVSGSSVYRGGRGMRWRIPSGARPALLVAGVASALLLGACRGEGRPNVEVIGGASASVSGADDPALNANSGARYSLSSQQDAALQAALDVRDLRLVINLAIDGRPVDWARVQSIYVEGKNQRRADGTVRSLAALATEPMPGAFPQGTSSTFDVMIRDALTGTGSAQGLSDHARREIVDRGALGILYGHSLTQLEAARGREASKAPDANTALDAAWAFAAGAPDSDGFRAYALMRLGEEREADFRLKGRLVEPLEAAFISAQEALARSDTAAFDRATSEARGLLNALFYLSTLRPALPLAGEPDAGDRQVLLAEGRASFAALQGRVRASAQASAAAVDEVYGRPATESFPPSLAASVYEAMNRAEVLRDLGIPAAVQVKSAQ